MSGWPAVALFAPANARRTPGGLPPACRHFFRLRDQHGTEVVATERRLGMHGAPNFRDFGGYRTTGGGRVKWGYLFRSGQLSSLSDQDVSLLASLALDLVFDFRRVEEQETDMSRLPLQPRPQVVSLPIVPGSNSRFFEQAGQQSQDPAAMFDFMLEINRDFAGPQARTYSRMFREILAAPDARFLVHCAAGKDCTGFAAAISCWRWGPRDLVMQDYLLTARYYLPQRELEAALQIPAGAHAGRINPPHAGSTRGLPGHGPAPYRGQLQLPGGVSRAGAGVGPVSAELRLRYLE
jgi:protein-tyrosine phosphatase